MPNTIAVIASCFANMNKIEMDYRSMIEALELEAKTKKGAGFANKKKLSTVKNEFKNL